MADQTDTQTTPDLYDPSAHDVAEVSQYLATVTPEEVQRVKDAEAADKDRATIRNWEPTPTPEDGHDGLQTPPETIQGQEPQDVTTKAQTFQDAAEKATPADTEDGYVGHSPERERTGMADKGLSQQNPAILDGGPVPDVRRGVDDSEALKD